MCYFQNDFTYYNYLNLVNIVFQISESDQKNHLTANQTIIEDDFKMYVNNLGKIAKEMLGSSITLAFNVNAILLILLSKQ